MPTTKKDVASTLSALTIDPERLPAKSKKPKAKQAVADSWEDEDISSSGSDDDDATPTDPAPSSTMTKGTSAPPPTPISPTYNNKGVNRQWSSSAAMDAFDEEGGNDYKDPRLADSEAGPSRRPEKTDAVARRMIAGALGIKPPKQTEEQKAYGKAVREQERKRREEEKAAEKKRQEEAEKAKAAIWDD
jgi:hypothetical protein